MNFRNIIVTTVLIFLSLLLSCSEDEPEEIPVPASKYYIQFKANGILKTFEADAVAYYATENYAICEVPPSSAHYALIQMINSVNLTGEIIESWENSTFNFGTGLSDPRATFVFLYRVIYFSDAVPEQSGTMKITSVEPNGTFEGRRLYKVSGTFNCKAENVDGTQKITVTNGRFVVGFSEN